VLLKDDLFAHAVREPKEPVLHKYPNTTTFWMESKSKRAKWKQHNWFSDEADAAFKSLEKELLAPRLEKARKRAAGKIPEAVFSFETNDRTTEAELTKVLSEQKWFMVRTGNSADVHLPRAEAAEARKNLRKALEASRIKGSVIESPP